MVTAPNFARAACKGEADLFFPAENETKEAGRVRRSRARRICAACPIAEPCLEYALAYPSPGIWAGTTEQQRHRIRRQRETTRP